MNDKTARHWSALDGRISHRSLISLLCLLLIVGSGILSTATARGRKPAQHRKRAKIARRVSKRAADKTTARRKSVLATEPLEGVSDGGEDDAEGRQQWFMFQRTYPFNSFPADARRKAWESRPRDEKGKRLESIQSPVWRSIGPTPAAPLARYLTNFGLNSGRINAIAVSPADPNLILVGASTGGIWRSIDGGVNFAPVTDTQVDLAVGSIAFSKSNPSIVYVGMGDMQGCCSYLGSGVLKSTDGGATWTHINDSSLPQPGAAGKIEVDPTDPNRVYLALYRTVDKTLPPPNNLPYGGFYLSTNGGVSWTNTLPGLPRDLVIDPANPQTLYLAMRDVGAFGGRPAGLYRSTDGGQNWSIIYPSPYGNFPALRDIRVAISTVPLPKIYVYSGNGSSSSSEIRLAVSNDGGSSFTDSVLTTVDKGQFGYNTYIYADPTNSNIVYVGARDVYKSVNDGVSWTNITGNFDSSFRFQPFLADTHPDQHALAFSPGTSNVIYIGNDGGLYKSVDGGVSFVSLNSTLSLTQFVGLARHPTDPAITYGGTQDNGTQRRLPATNQWQDFAGGDGGQCVINPLNPSIVFTTYVHGSISRYDNNGLTFVGNVANDSTFQTNGVNDRTAFFPPFTGNGVNATLYFGTYRLFVSTDLGATWSAPGGTTDLTTGNPDTLSAIGVARSDPNVIYTGSAQGRAMVSTNGGQNWTDITAGLPNRFITGIKVDGANSAVAYLTVSGFGSGHVFKTTNTGAKWTDISGNLPDIPTSALHIDSNNPNILYAGTDIGVFRSTTGGNAWATFNDGLPPVVVTAFSANSSGQIQVATYGRGAYEASIAAPDDFSLTSVTPLQNIVAGGTASYQINTATTSGNAQAVSLSVGGLPSGATATFNPPSVTSGGSSTLTVTTASATPVGSYSLTIQGSGSSTHSVVVTLTVSGSANPIDDARTFVTQHYLDFLNRQPDQGGLDYWTGQLTACGSDAGCMLARRVTVSAAYFTSDEFQQTGYYVYRFYKGSLGRQPLFAEFMADRSQVVGGATLDAGKAKFASDWVQRAGFLQLYPRVMAADQFVDKLLQTVKATDGVDLSSQRSALISRYDGTDSGRAGIVRAVVESQAFATAEYNAAFVLMQYFGYLRRDPDAGGYQFWLGVMNGLDKSAFKGMTCAFITSAEYQLRFGSAVTHTNRDCGQ